MNRLDKAISYYYVKVARGRVHLRLNSGMNDWYVATLQEELDRDELVLDALEHLRSDCFLNEQ